MKKQLLAVMVSFVGSGLVVCAGPAVGADEIPSPAEIQEEAASMFEAIPAVVPSVRDNAITYEKIELGKNLFFDPRLSRSGFLSCNSCHMI